MTDRRAMVEGIRAAHTIDRDQPWMKEKPEPGRLQPGGPTDVELTDAGDPAPQQQAAGDANNADNADVQQSSGDTTQADDTPDKPHS